MKKRGRPNKATQINTNFDVNLKLVQMQDINLTITCLFQLKQKQ